MPYKLAQLLVSPEHKSDILSRIFVSQPSMEEEQILGKLFVLVEIKNQKTDIMLANFIIDRINLFYYQNEQAPLLARLATVTVSDIFESSLAKLNQEIVNFTQIEKISFNPENFNATIGVLFKNKLYFTGIGHNKALLIYKSKTKNNRQINDYNLLNITASTADPTQEIVLENKLFTNTVSGSVPPEGYMIFANESLYEFLSEKQLIKIITTLPPSGAAEQIKNILEQTNIYMPFTGLIIKNQQPQRSMDSRLLAVDPRVKLEPSTVHHAIEPKRRREQDFRQERDLNKESIKNLNRTAAKTAQILRPPGFINIEKIKRLLKKIKLSSANKQQNKLIIKRSDLSWIKREGILSVKKISLGFLKGASFIFSVTADGWHAITNRQEPQEIKIKASLFKQKFNKKHLIVLTVFVFFMLTFVFSLYYTKVQKDKRLKEEAWTQANDQFSQKEKQIEADLIYENKNKAQLSLEEMTNILKDLETNVGDKHTQELSSIKERYQALVDEISGLIRLTAPNKVWTLADDQSADSLVYANGQLYLASWQQNSAHSLDLTNNNYQPIIDNEAGLRLLNTDRDGNIFFLSQNKLISIDKAGRQKNQNLSDELSEPVVANVYNNRFYVFNHSDKQIYRYQISANLSNPSTWLEEALSVDINDIAIDASIFLLTNDQILKYDSGQSQFLILDPPFPAITQAKKLVAPSATDILAVLEPAAKRLIIFSRSGKLLSQYTAEAWTDLKDLSFEPGGKIAYILNGSDIYKLDLSKNQIK